MAQAPDTAAPSARNEVCVGPSSTSAGTANSCDGCPSQKDCAAGNFKDAKAATTQQSEAIAARLESVSHILLILSGKGGVGKSTVSSQLAHTLAFWGLQVGILDIDICGPSIARMMGVESQEVHKSATGWTPVYAEDNLAVMSVAFMLHSKNDAIIWRGPRKSGLIRQFLTDVTWDELDFLIIDAPPGTSDEHISIIQYLSKVKRTSAVIVTTPQEMSLLDVRKEVSFCHKTNMPILGVIENMSGFVCPCCQTRSDIFVATTGGAQKMCTELKQTYLGALPIDSELLKMCDSGQCFVSNTKSDNATRKALIKLVLSITDKVSPQIAEKVKLAATNAEKSDKK